MSRTVLTRCSFVAVVSLFVAQDKVNQADAIHENPPALTSNSLITDFSSQPMTSWTKPQPSYSYDEATTDLMKTSNPLQTTLLYTEKKLTEGEDNQTNQIHDNPSTSAPNRKSTRATSQPVTSRTKPQSSYHAYHETSSNPMKTSSSKSSPMYTAEILKQVTQANQIHEETPPSTPNRKSSDVTPQPMTSWTKPQPSYTYDEATTVTTLMMTSNSSISTSSYTEEITSEDAGVWTSWGNSSYNFVTTSKLSWDEAVEECSSLLEGAHLVFIEGEEEHMFISDMLDSIPQPGIVSNWWIGFTDREQEGVWKWYDNPASYSKWATFEPNDGIGLGTEDCAALGSLVSWDWIDVNCETWKLKFICEVDESM